MKTQRLIKIFLFAGFIVASACQHQENRLDIDETYTLSSNDKRPFGGYTTRHTMDTVFGNESIELNNKNFNKWYNSRQEAEAQPDNQVYIILSPKTLAYEGEANAMVNYMSSGNTLLLMTDAMSAELETALQMQIVNELERLPFAMTREMTDTHLSLKDSTQNSTQNFSYYYYPLLHGIYSSVKSAALQTIAVNSANQPSIVRKQVGQGQLIIATNARAFGNYFLLSSGNHNYLMHLLSYLPAEPSSVIWDAFYQRNLNRSPEGYSLFKALLAIPALRWSFWILISLAIIWVLTNLRRKQRMIPVLPANTNTTVSFVETIAQLYFNKQDHANIGRKMTAHFLDYLRTSFYMPPHIAGDEWASILSQKTDLSKAEAQEAAHLMHKAQTDDNFTATDLFKLHTYMGRVKNLAVSKQTVVTAH